MRTKSKVVSGLLVGAVLVSASWAADAGYQTSQNVYVIAATPTSNGWAYGSMGTARNSADSVQWIGCSVVAYTTSTVLYCDAQPLTGGYNTCQTTNPNLIAAAAHLSEGSRLTFSWDYSGNCTKVSVENYSYWAPKVP